jgi:hypothetical protein
MIILSLFLGTNGSRETINILLYERVELKPI